MRADLHLHSAASDGTDDPATLPVLAREAGLDAIALTDHDTTAGLAGCQQACQAAGLDFIPGVELSADPVLGEHETAPPTRHPGTLHLLGYFIEPAEPQLERLLRWLAQSRHQRIPAILSRLDELGVRIAEEEVCEESQRDVSGRAHIAQILLRKGYVKSVHEAFTRYLGQQGAAWVPKALLPPAEAIAAIKQARGLAVLAHPVQLSLDHAELEHLVARLKDMGLDGLETRHSAHRPADEQQFEALAKRFELIRSGGSDYHGRRKAVRLGEPSVGQDVLERLWEARQKTNR